MWKEGALARASDVRSLKKELLSLYFQEIRKYEPLSSEEERNLAERIARGDTKARDALVRANLRFVVSVAEQYKGKGMGLSDLICEGNLGLLKAVEKFDGARGVRFISYAVWWIRQTILEALARHSRTVRLPLNQVAMLGQIGRACAELEQECARSVTAGEIAYEMGLQEDQIRDTLMVGQNALSLDAPRAEEDERCLLDLVEDPHPSPEEEAMGRLEEEDLENAVSSLSPREGEVLRWYFGLGGRESLTLEEIAGQYGLTRERIRQIKDRALERLRRCPRRRKLESYSEE